MQPRYDDSPFDWIRKGRRELLPRTDSHWAGNFVSHLMPTTFVSYVKVLHTIEACYDWIDNPLTQKEISILKIPSCKELRSLIESRRGGTSAEPPRIRWKELADLLNVPFASEICLAWYRKRLEEGCWPRFLAGPDEGLLVPPERKALVSVLQRFVGGDGCFFRFSEIPLITMKKPLLFHGGLDELEDVMKSGPYQFSPEYWWPPNHSWCVCSDYDLMFTVIGGSKELISNLLDNDALECIAVGADTRIDYFAPMPT